MSKVRKPTPPKVAKGVNMSRVRKPMPPSITKSSGGISLRDILAALKRIELAIADLKEQVKALGSQTLPPRPMVKPKIDPSGC